MNPTTTGKNITQIPTAQLQTNLGIKSDNIYGPQTTAAVKAFQTANGLLADGIFGPKTQAVYNTKYGTGNSIVSTTDIHNGAKTDSSALTNALNMNNLPSSSNPINTTNNTAMNTTTTDPITGAVTPGAIPTTTTNPTADPYIAQLNAMSDRSNASTKMLISNIVAQKANQANAINKQFENYTRGLQLLGIQQNSAQSSPDLLMGHIQDAENQHMEKINALNSEEAKALMDAENARADNDFKLLQESMSHYKDIQTQKTQALKDYNDSLMNQPKVAAVAAHDIYATMNTLDDADKETFLIAVAKKFDIPLGSLVTALSDEKSAQDKAALAIENTQTTIDKRMGTTSGTTSTTSGILKVGSSGQSVKDLQTKLGITADGQFGPKTVAAVKAYQQANGLTVDGIVGSQTAAKLGLTLASTTSSSPKTSTTFKSAPAISSVTTQMNSIKGADNYIDPYEWNKARTNWGILGGSDSSFVSNFKKYLNPASYDKAGFPKPTTSTSSTKSS